MADAPVTDLATAQAMIATLRAEVTVLRRENTSLRRELDALCRRLYGKTSEQVDPRQLQLALEQLANEPGAVTEPLEMDSGETPVRGHARRRPTGRRPCPRRCRVIAWRSMSRRPTSTVRAAPTKRSSARPRPRSSNIRPRRSA